jgi:hypothetical protein
MMARHSGVPVPTIGERPSRDDVTPWETQQLEPESPSTASYADSTAAVAAGVRHKRASRILSGSFFSRGS